MISTGVQITLIICVTIIAVMLIDKKKKGDK